jgi:peptidyl-prolyl cis-trans isomerase C
MIKILRKKKKPIFWILMISFVVGTIFLSWGVGQQRKQSAENPQYASINGEPVTGAEYEETKARIIERYKNKYKDFDESMVPDVHKRAVDEVVKRKLLFAEAKKMGIKISEKELIRTTRLSFQDDNAYQQARKTWSGRYWKWREQEIRDEILISRMETIITDGAEPTDKEIREYFDKWYQGAEASHILIDPASYVSEEKAKKHYEDFKEDFKKPGPIRVRHILIAAMEGVSPQEDQQAKAKADSLLQQLKGGADFGELAQKNSNCASAARGGDLGTFSQGMMVPEFEKAAFALEVGQTSDVVKTMFGYHIIKCEWKGEPIQQAYLEVREKIRETLGQEDDAIGSASTAAKRIVREIKEGTLTFSEAVQKYSDAKASKKNQGRLGVIPRGFLPPQEIGTGTKRGTDTYFAMLQDEIAFGRMIAPQFSEGCFALKEGKVSDPVKTPFGFHIIKVDRFLPANEKRYEKEKDEIREMATSQKKNLFLGEWYKCLKKKAKVRMGEGFSS